MTTPVVWVVDAEHWPRALLRAELIERGYDAVGFLRVDDALNARPDRFPDLIIVESHGLSLSRDDALKLFLLQAPVVLIASAPEGNARWIRDLSWAAVFHRPVSIGEIADAVERLHPISRDAR